MLKIHCLKLHQKQSSAQSILIGKISGAQIRDYGEQLRADCYERDKGQHTEEGYQRPLSSTAVDKIVNYLVREIPNPILPTSIVLSSRIALPFTPISEDASYGVLDVPSENILWEIDGQHRVEGLKQILDATENSKLKSFEDFDLPVIILNNFSRDEEVEQFYVINSRQQKISTDLAQRHLLQIEEGNRTTELVPKNARWQLVALKIVDRLNEDPDSPLFERISIPTDDLTVKKTRSISQSAIINSMKPLFTGTTALFKINHNSEEKIDDWADVLKQFWTIVLKIYPEAFESPDKYILLKSVGMYSLHLFLKKAEIKTKPSELDSSMRARVKNRLEKAADRFFSVDFWNRYPTDQQRRTGKYAGVQSSARGHNKIANGLLCGEWIE